jgi:hypothetical protein
MLRVDSPAARLLFCTVRLETTGPHFSGTGTAFLFGHEHRGGYYVFLVTNKHVVQGATSGKFFFTRRDGPDPLAGPLVGERWEVLVNDFEAEWHGHPDPAIDITIMPIGGIINSFASLNQYIYAKGIDQNWIPTPEQYEDLDAIEEVIFIGYPNGIVDQANLTPIIRRGTTASHPQLDYDGEPVFLIDASVFPGSSGSPVFIYNAASYPIRGQLMAGTRVLFLGVVAEVLIQHEEGQISFEPIPTTHQLVVRSQQMIDLGVVFKARTVVETIEDFLSRHSL